jgi:hypothetical protein
MSNTKITSNVIESGAVTTTHIASGAISASHLTGVTTANITENTNLYYTDTRARASISVTGGNLSYDNLTGVLQLTDSEIRDAISATSSGDGSLIYTAGTGVIAYTGPSASEVRAHLSAGTGVTYSGGQISIGQAVGTSDTVSFGNITTAGYLRGPANFTIDPAAYGDDTGTLIIAGNLQVDGTTTTINSTTLTVDDLNLTLASGAANAAAANGAGITVDGASATLLYQASGDKFVFNKALDVGPITSTGVIAAGTVATMFTSSDRAYLVAGTSDSSNQHLYLGSYHGSTLKQLTFSGSNNALYPQTTASIDLGLSSHKFKDAHLSGVAYAPLVVANDIKATGSGGISFQTDDGIKRIEIADSGEVGIGLGSYADPRLKIKSAAGGDPAIHFDASAANRGAQIKFLDNGSFLGGFIDYHHNGDKMKFGAGSSTTPTMTVGDQVVGIGTDSPDALLHVAGTALVENAKLKAIGKDISDTAVDVFVYDTSKDSDGGAWRKRTQHTSWYNETLNTSTRGARKEFPSVAVIVALPTAGNNVTIYDGDDPDLPMWMKFTLLNQDIVSIAAVNGQICLGNKWAANSGYGGNGLVLFDFAADRSRHGLDNATVPSYDPERLGVISGSQSATAIWPKTSTNGARFYDIVNTSVNDVAMTVLPNAPIDADSGLPVPTIAVATNGGVSIIKDDGKVIDITNGQDGSAFNYIDNLFFRKDGALVWVGDSSTNTAAERFVQVLHNLPTVNTNQGSVEGSSVIDEQYGPSHKNGSKLKWATTAGVKATSDAGENFAVGTSGALHLIKYNREVEQEGFIAHITSDYNTGYMHGDIKLATLSDTDTTSTPELITNGTFDSDISGWSSGANAVLSHSSSGIANAATGYNSYAYINFTLTSGKQYIFRADITSDSQGSGGSPRIAVTETASDSTFLGSTTTSGVGSYSVTFTATGATRVRLIKGSNTGTTIYDNVSLRLAEPDHSYNNNGLQTFGTVTKTAVATGAELVGYSGFSANDYLKQNLDWTIGTGDFTFSFWVNPVTGGSYFHAISIGTESIGGQSSGNGIVLKLNASDGSPYFYTGAGGASQSTYNAANALSAGTWSQVVCGRKSGVFYIYINGDLAQTGSSNNFSISDTVMTLGRGIGHSEYVGGTKIALVRISKTFPTAEQIAKMYNDEKHLFATNAKATLYGTSDSITALAYDDDTELLHVGTSAGRSVFQGLNRVDNTTDAVGAAISASNGLVAED